jgi:hypothetical protein
MVCAAEGTGKSQIGKVGLRRIGKSAPLLKLNLGVMTGEEVRTRVYTPWYFPKRGKYRTYF